MKTVFISHSNMDNIIANRLYDDLRKNGFTVWIDNFSLEAGAFVEQINDALVNCDWFVLIQSPNAIKSPAVRSEVNTAISLHWKSKIQGIIPFIIESCEENEIPPLWLSCQYCDATENYQLALNDLLSKIDPSTYKQDRSIDNPDLVPLSLKKLGFRGLSIEETDFIMPPVCEIPIINRKSKISRRFNITKYPITVAEYRLAVKAKAVPDPLYFSDRLRLHRLIDHPVVFISWMNAMDYSAWLSLQTGYHWRLPTHAEWFSAATERQWEAEWDPKRGNTQLGNIDLKGNVDKVFRTTPVYQYEEGKSVYGVFDMLGNVWEWTGSLFNAREGHNEVVESLYLQKDNSVMILMGGSWDSDPINTRLEMINMRNQNYANFNTGFRLVMRQ